MPPTWTPWAGSGSAPTGLCPDSQRRRGREAEGSPCRLPDFDDSDWMLARTLGAWRRSGVSFVWYRIKATLPETVGGRALEGARCLFESCIDDYGEIWINGECDRERATVQGLTYRSG